MWKAFAVAELLALFLLPWWAVLVAIPVLFLALFLLLEAWSQMAADQAEYSRQEQAARLQGQAEWKWRG
jgi:protein-S-isoprenylcysteine O-methyltransferase Ste14